MTREEIEKKAKEIAESFRTARCFSKHPSDIAYSAAIEMANWADQHPREGLWDAEKVCKWISERIGIDQKIETNSDGVPLADSYIAYCIARQNAADTIIKDLRKAMED